MSEKNVDKKISACTALKYGCFKDFEMDADGNMML